VQDASTANSGLRRALEAFPEAEFVARAPGRANLIGEHTDYNEGFVLPVALDLATYIAGRRAGSLRLRSLDESGDLEIDVTSGAGPERGWGRYATAVVRALLEAGHDPTGFEGVVASDVPVGAGLSSSAALEIALALALAPDVRGLEMARICRRAENHFVGVACGLMDQLTATAAVAGKGLLIDCQTYDVTPIPLPESLAVLVVDSGVSRDLASSQYNDRVRECRAAARELELNSLRGASGEDLDRLQNPVLRRRARHVISENERVLEAASALRTGATRGLRDLFAESHRSYAIDFEASTPEIDVLVDVAAGTEGVVAARLTGGGFGGCTVNLVDTEFAENAAHTILRDYRNRVGLRGRAWITGAGPGASILRPPDG
jgi:galactokinase